MFISMTMQIEIIKKHFIKLKKHDNYDYTVHYVYIYNDKQIRAAKIACEAFESDVMEYKHYNWLFSFAIKCNDLETCKYITTKTKIKPNEAPERYKDTHIYSMLTNKNIKMLKWFLSEINSNVCMCSSLIQALGSLRYQIKQLPIGTTNIYNLELFERMTIAMKLLKCNDCIKLNENKQYIKSEMDNVERIEKEKYINGVLMMFEESNSQIHYLTKETMFDINIFAQLVPEYLFY